MKVKLKKKLRFPENDDNFEEIEDADNRFKRLFESAADQPERQETVDKMKNIEISDSNADALSKDDERRFIETVINNMRKYRLSMENEVLADIAAAGRVSKPRGK